MPLENAALWKVIWKLKATRVVTMFVWKACNNIFPTEENLLKRGIIKDAMCPICGHAPETVGHALWTCLAAKDVWTEHGMGIQKCPSDDGVFIKVFERLLGRLSDEDMQRVIFVARHVWFRRNKVVFGEELFPLGSVNRIAIEHIELFNSTE